MKKIHLLCNAHLDPIWLWARNEGIAEAISTFRVAADFCEKYDNFVFNHNESLLYEWVEEYEPELFERIKKLVKQGKWRIMGGWYLQPDCLMPSGEAFLRQIETGNSYFKEKFGEKPTTAINFDPFGHSRGLVQILKKTGYDSYLYMRPHTAHEYNDFIWKGYDGSEILAHRFNGGYNSGRGTAAKKLSDTLENAHDGANIMLWGVGNHGGGPSRVDIEQLDEFIKNHPDVIIEHSFAEKYFSEVDKEKLPVYDKSLVHCMIGCYTSMVRIKQNYRALENELVTTEKMLSVSGIEYDKKQFKDAEKALLFSQFHDILPGSMIKEGENETLRILGYGREIASKLRDRAFFKLCEGQGKCPEGEIPVLVFNPHPYKIEAQIEAEFQLADQNWNLNEVTLVNVKDENGNLLPTQNEKEASSLNLDWRKRIVFTAELKPMSINRFNCLLHIENADKRPIAPCEENATHFVFNNGKMSVLINKSTGLIDKYEVNGKNLLKEGSSKILVYKDNADPWGMTVDGFNDCIGQFEPLEKSQANAFAGFPDADYENVHVIENGEVRTKIQAIFKNRNSFAVVTYTLPKQSDYIDIAVKTFANDVDTVYKLSFDTTVKTPQFWGQSAFGREEMRKDGNEVTFQKWCALKGVGEGFAILNRGTYAGSSKDGTLNITLMRTPVYSAHPIDNRPVLDDDRNHNRIDMGERDFEYRLSANLNTLDRDAEIFNQPPYTLSFFPSGLGEKRDTTVEVSNPETVLTSLKKAKNGNFLVRLFNSTDKKASTDFTAFGKTISVDFTPYEIKAFLIKENSIDECNLLGEE